MPCGNSTSNINVSKTFVTINPEAFAGSRFIISIPSTDYQAGITGGDVIYYDIAGTSYLKADANSATKSEVVGIVESRDSSTGALTVVTQGSINLPSRGITYLAGETGGAGGLDVYFLSDREPGLIQPVAPSDTGRIIKPIYQVAPHSSGSYSGIVTNYIGYSVTPDIETLVGGFASSVGSIVFTFGEITDSDYIPLDGTSYIPWTNENEAVINRIGTSYGLVYKIKLKSKVTNELLTSLTLASLGNGATRIDAVYYKLNIEKYNTDENDRRSKISIFGKNIFVKDPSANLNFSWNNTFLTSSISRQSVLLGFETITGLASPTAGDIVFYSISGDRFVSANKTSRSLGTPSVDPNINNGLTSVPNPYTFMVKTDAEIIECVLAEPATIIGVLPPKIDIITNLYQSAPTTVLDGSKKEIAITSQKSNSLVSVKTYMKIRDSGNIKSFIPNAIEIKSLHGNTITIGDKANNLEEDLETVITDLRTRLAAVESRLNIV